MSFSAGKRFINEQTACFDFFRQSDGFSLAAIEEVEPCVPEQTT
ncbi:MAG TPA: hypothetical protein VGM27_01430 [Acidobacteriaceae bacterium]|jgi:hypothetical protein